MNLNEELERLAKNEVSDRIARLTVSREVCDLPLPLRDKVQEMLQEHQNQLGPRRPVPEWAQDFIDSFVRDRIQAIAGGTIFDREEFDKRVRAFAETLAHIPVGEV